MATLDDKLLGEKLHYYCSSSESEGEEEEDDLEDAVSTLPTSAIENRHSNEAPQPWEGSSCNTGPKGVLKDYQRYKQLEREQREEQKEELARLTKKFSLTCRTNAEDDRAQEEEKKLEEELSELLDDSYIHKFVQQRMKEMLYQESNRRCFGQVFLLKDCDQFLAAVDDEDKNVCVLVLLYEPNSAGCSCAIRAFEILSRDYQHFKFCMVRPSFISMSANFKVGGVPAILAYKGGQLMGNFVKLTNDLSNEFDHTDLEGFLIEHGILTDKNLVPNVVRNLRPSGDSSDDE